MSLPLVPAKTQFDGSDHASENCTCTSGARLMRYATGRNVTGGAVRSHQTDQSGGTSIPDVMRALHNGWSFEPVWAASNDSNAGASPQPANKVSSSIDATRLQRLLAGGYMVMLQGDYGDLPVKYREQVTFRDDHCFTVDDWDKSRLRYYVVDTIPRASSGYKGRWIPLAALHSYAYGLAGNGRMYAAWARPRQLPDTSEAPMDDFAIPQQIENVRSNKATKLYKKSDLSGTGISIPANYMKRHVGDLPNGIVIVGHDVDTSKPGKSALFGKSADWDESPVP